MVRKAIYGFLIGIGAGLVALILWSAGALDRFEARTWDWRVQSLAKPSRFTENVRLIFIRQPNQVEEQRFAMCSALSSPTGLLPRPYTLFVIWGIIASGLFAAKT